MIAERRVYMWNRWQDPSLGRFISEDPVRDGSNWYAYAGNNPISKVDPKGLDIDDFYDALRATAGSSAASQSVSDTYNKVRTHASPTVSKVIIEDDIRKNSFSNSIMIKMRQEMFKQKVSDKGLFLSRLSKQKYGWSPEKVLYQHNSPSKYFFKLTLFRSVPQAKRSCT